MRRRRIPLFPSRVCVDLASLLLLHDRSAAGATPHDAPEMFYGPQDFIVGRVIHVLGRDILLRACDPFTRTFYETELGISQPEPIVPDVVPPAAAEVGLWRA